MSAFEKELGEDFLSCVLCRKLLRDPRLLPCLHSVCTSCANSRLRKSGECISCPICEDVEVISSIENTFLNHWLKNVIDIIDITQNSKGKFCSFCKLKGRKQEAVATCLTCLELLCKTCWESRHTFTTLTKDHHVVSIEEVQTGRYHSEIRSNQKIHCSDHNNEYYKFFCKTCDVPICRDCTVLQHRSHAHISSKDALKHIELQKEIERVEKGIFHLKILQSKLDKQSKDSENCEENLRIQIETTCNSMINKISAQRRSLERSLTQSLKNPKEKIKMKTEIMQKKNRLAERTISFCKCLLKNGTDFEILSMQSLIVNKLKQSSVIIEKFSTSDHRIAIPQLSTNWREPELKLVFENELNDSEKENLPTETKDVYKQAEDKVSKVDMFLNENADVGIQCNLIGHNGFQINEDVTSYGVVIECSLITNRSLSNICQRPKISSVSWKDNDSFIVVDQCNNTLHSCSMEFSGKSVELDNCVDSTVTSWCIAIRKGSAEVVVLSLKFKHKHCIPNVSVMFANSTQSINLACMSKSIISIYSGDIGNVRRMTCTDNQGETIQFRQARFGCILSTGEFALSDINKDFVYMFDKNARLFRKEFCFPGSITPDKDDLIYIADFYEHRVIVTNFEGSLRNTISLLPHVSHPRSISISSDHKLAVAFENSVSLFQLDVRQFSIC
ncbi:E3 ubiquitin-protein ligase TRIM56-like [Magallana gigas]|uniref:E3 ubiquitin-protein ligase TRIM56-like n=1 Tax=Magallana gigas TaxID=29159 RepID=UPI00148A605E|nr:E3 ubiquitin-protein ligase TRIM56-like [Crassostrea gigas]